MGRGGIRYVIVAISTSAESLYTWKGKRFMSDVRTSGIFTVIVFISPKSGILGRRGKVMHV